MKRIICLLVLCLFAVASATAQIQKKANYALAFKFENDVEKFDNDLSPTIYFINDTDRFWYCHKTSDGVKYFIVDPAKKSKRELFNVAEFYMKISEITHKAYNIRKVNIYTLKFDKNLPVFEFELDGDKFSYNYQTKTLKQLEKAKQSSSRGRSSGYRYSPDSLRIIYAKQHNLYMIGNKDKGMDTTVVQLTTDGTQARSYAQYPNEGLDGITSPAGRWLKNSKQFLIEIVDMTACDMNHVINMVSEPLPTLKSYKYCSPGDKNIWQYTLHVLDIATKKITDIKVDKWKDQLVEYAFHSKEGGRLYIFRTKRTWDEKELLLYDLNAGTYKVLFNEVDKPFFDFVIAQSHFINDGKEIIFRSERTGYGHFYLYDGLTGKLKRQITGGEYVTGQVQEIDTLRRDVYFYGMGREKGIDPYYSLLYKVNLDKGDVQLLTPEYAKHSVTISKSRNVIIDSYSTVSTPPRTVVRSNSGKVLLELEKPDLREIYERGWRAPERFKVKSADGLTDLYGVMWKPMNFDSTKTYPIISEVYPGPQFEYVPTEFEIEGSKAAQLAQLGFIVIQVGHRGGSPIRGKFYHRQSYDNMRDYPLADDRAAISELARRHKFIDVTKVGIYGHSGGGFMSTAALCKYPDFYTAAVSCAGNHDNRIYNTGWVEMNNGVEEVVKVKKDSINGDTEEVTFKSKRIDTNMDLAKNYKGHLLLVHGMMDDNVNPAHSMRMAKALMKAGKNFDMIFLPESDHGFSGDEDTFFRMKMWRHFAKYLLNDASGDYQAEINKFYEPTKQ